MRDVEVIRWENGKNEIVALFRQGGKGEPPACGRRRLLIGASRTLVSAGTERMLVDFGKAGWITSPAMPMRTR